MVRAKLLRTLALALGVVVIVAAIGVVGFNMQHSAAPVHASGTGNGGACYVMTGSAPTCLFKGFTADADYSSYDTSTCAEGVYTDYTVYAADNVQMDPSNSTIGGPTVFVGYTQWNNCTYEYTSYYGEGTATIKTTGNLGSATVQATVPLQDWSYNMGPTVTVDMTWTGFGPISTVSENISSRNGDTMFRSRYTGSNRMAMVNGTITSGASTYTLTTTGTLSDATGGDILLQHS
jgi:hypothetical protein